MPHHCIGNFFKIYFIRNAFVRGENKLPRYSKVFHVYGMFRVQGTNSKVCGGKKRSSIFGSKTTKGLLFQVLEAQSYIASRILLTIH